MSEAAVVTPPLVCVSSYSDLQLVREGDPACVVVPSRYVAPVYSLIQLSEQQGRDGDLAREIMEVMVSLRDGDMRAVIDGLSMAFDIAWSLR